MGRSAKQEAVTLEEAAASSYWTEAEARVVLEAYEASGLSQAEFAHRHGLKAQRLKWWRSKLGSEAKALSFVPVQVVSAAPVAQATAPGESLMEVVLASGRRVRVGPGFEERALARLVRLLEEGTC